MGRKIRIDHYESDRTRVDTEEGAYVDSTGQVGQAIRDRIRAEIDHEIEPFEPVERWYKKGERTLSEKRSKEGD